MSAAAWIERVDLALAEERLGKRQVERSLSEERGYAVPPRVDGAGRVHASVVRAATTGGVRVGRDERTDVTVRLGASLEVACSCPSRGRFLCEHVTALVVDLAVSPALRAALLRGEDTHAASDALPALRRSLLDEQTLDERLARWLPAPLEAELEIDVEPSRPLGAARSDERPIVLVRFRRADTREPLPPRALEGARLASRDRRLVELLVPSMHVKDAFAATRAQASLVLDLLSRDLRTKTHRFKRPARFERTPLAVRVDVDGERLVARFASADARVLVDAEDALLFAGPKPFVHSLVDERFHPVAPEVDLDVAWGLVSVPSLPLNERTRERIGRTLLTRARRAGIELPAPDVFGLPALERPTFRLRVEGTVLALRAHLEAVYGGAVTFVVSPAELASERAATDGRHVDAESEALARVLASGFSVGEDGACLVADEDDAVRYWREGAAGLGAEPRIETVVAPSLAGTVRFGEIAAHVASSAESGWLDVHVDFSAAMVKVELATLRRALSGGRRWVALEDGTLARIGDEVAMLVGDLEGSTGHLRLPAYQVGRVDRWLARFEGSASPALATVRARLAALARGPRRMADAPAAVNAALRPYQRVALAWLEDLRALGAGGILADDMGLGKTLVTLAFLASDRAPARGPALVVCPTSVLGNWASEAARFVPTLRVTTWRSGRPPLETLSKADGRDVVLTTYGLLRRHAKTLARTPFSVLVLDEAQSVKNADAETTRAARDVDAAMRVALTGTPVENRLDELWSIMNVVNEGLLGSRADFERVFAAPAASTTDAAVVERLRALVRPFVMRRTKGEVLDDLPPKTEIDRVCVLGLRQKRLYDALAHALRESVKKDLQKRGDARTRLSVLTAILRLRQMACDPRLVDPTIEAAASAKREAFLDLVRELVSEGRRALVFSQFTSLLALWREDLDREGIAYAYLDGQTRERDAVVARFRAGDAPLFLISLKAGGVGMNLTEADTVVFCDPWWNPAVESQAEDRAHRPGQTKPVTVIRLVAEGTIEQKVSLLKEHKRALADAVLDDAGPSEPVDDDELALLFDGTLDDAAPDDVAPERAARARVVSTRTLDALRAMVRYLEETGFERRALARAVRVPAAQLALLEAGHRIRLSERAATRIEELHAKRRGTPRTI